jgi:predicted RNA-binding Zn-ribbon protein involved in translation (DUF1610 family)
MTARDEMKRLSPSTTPLKTLADIIEGCCVEKPGIHVYDMCLGDYEYLLHKLRIVTYGEKYSLTCKCSECYQTIDAETNLGEMEIQEFDVDQYNNARTFVLPTCGKTVTLKIQSPRLMEETEVKVKEMQRKYKGASIDFETMCKLLCNIETVDGIKMNQYDLEGFINNLAARDMQKILNQIDVLGRQVGVKNLIYIKCPNCGSDIATFFRYGPEFFRPTNI